MAGLFEKLKAIAIKSEATFVLTISADYDELPEFLKEIADK